MANIGNNALLSGKVTPLVEGADLRV